MSSTTNIFLTLGALLSAIAALLHVGCIIFGAPWYRFFGAGERMARMAEAGSWQPAVVTSFIVAVLVVWSLYALAGAGRIAPLPFLRPVLCVITGIYLLRGLAVLPLAAYSSIYNTPFWWWSSAICLTLGLVHLLGLTQVWARLS